MDRRIPEALSTSRERNRTVDPRAIGEAPDGRKMVAELRDALVTELANVKSTFRVDRATKANPARRSVVRYRRALLGPAR